MLLTSCDGASLELRVSGYQYPVPPPAPPGERDWDANWLQVHGAVRTAHALSWTFQDPCLTTWEARELSRWLEAAAQDSPPAPQAGLRDGEEALSFTEPNLAFTLAPGEGEHLVVAVRLSHESAPARPEHQKATRASSAQDVLLHLTREDLHQGARAWDDDLAAFPPR